jgi:chemotaxis protein histidine kinase CheA
MTFPITIQVLAFVFGALLILIGIVGGGFEIKELKIPKVSIAGRVIAGLIGSFFFVVAFGFEVGLDLLVKEKRVVAQERPKPEAGEATDEHPNLAERKAALADQARAVAEEKARIADAKIALAEKALEIAERQAEVAKDAQKVAEDARRIAEQNSLAAETARAAEKKAAEEVRNAAVEKAQAAVETQKRQEALAEQARATAAEDAKSARDAQRTAEKEAMAAEDARKSANAGGVASGDVVKKFKIRKNRDMYGEDIPQSDGRAGYFALSVDECAARCDSTSACVAFAFDHWNKRCYPKRDIVTSVLSPKSKIGVKDDYEIPKVSARTPEMKLVRNKRFQGEPIERMTVEDFEACKSHCERNLKCVAFNFVKEEDSTVNCEVFNESQSGYLTDVSADGGWKEQSP